MHKHLPMIDVPSLRFPLSADRFLTSRGGTEQVDPSVIYGDMDPMSPPFETPSEALRERYGGGDGESDRPAWWGRWGKPLAEAGGFSDWQQPRSAPA